MSADPHSLAGAYALDALAADERAEFERHLTECPDCRNEVDEFLATAARLGAAEAKSPPAGLKARVLAEVARTRQQAPAVAERHEQTEPRHVAGVSRMWRRATFLAAAAVVLVLIAGGVTVVVQHRELTETRQQVDQMSEIAASSDARLIQEPVTGGGSASVIVSEEHDAGVLLLADLPPTSTDQTYQLWFIDDEGASSAGTVDLHEPQRVSRTLRGVSVADAVGITVEPLGGSPAPTSDPVVALEL